jgi:predicted O-linked N-acetylglucosamine transferase (SPINDLY family)
MIRDALDLYPDDPELMVHLGGALMDQRNLHDSGVWLERARASAPEDPRPYIGLANLYLRMGRAADAAASFRQATALDPENSNYWSGALFTEHYLCDVSNETLQTSARDWGRKFADSLTAMAPPHGNDPDPERRLRIGYVSGDFHEHPVGRILLSIFAHHDREKFEVFCYATRRVEDDVARGLREMADHWRLIEPLSDAAAAEQIRGDAIDVLVDLSGHTAHNRLLMFARKPAPVQSLWLGYWDTTGLTAMDYLIVDPQMCPPGEKPSITESVVRLPFSMFTYSPPKSAIVPGPVPSTVTGQITFGSMNNLAKITPAVVSLWSRVLNVIPRSRMLLRYFGFDEPDVRTWYTRLFSENGVSEDRLQFDGGGSLDDHLLAYNHVDVALDTFPYSGGMTTVDALWMGVPVVTLASDRMVGRMSAGILSAASLDDLITYGPDEYVALAADLAHNPARLTELRMGMRDRVLQSPLANGLAQTRALESLYQQMWQRWCVRNDPAKPCGLLPNID